jgi:hypothetical protein
MRFAKPERHGGDCQRGARNGVPGAGEFAAEQLLARLQPTDFKTPTIEASDASIAAWDVVKRG